MRASLARLVRAALRELPSFRCPDASQTLIRLDLNESPHSLPREVMDDLAGIARTLSLNRYPDPSSARLRALLADRHGVGADQVIIGNGADENISILCEALGEPRMCGESARVLFPSPSFPGFRRAALATGCDAVTVPLAENFELDVPALMREISVHRPNIVFMARPSTTGQLCPIDVIADLAARFPDTVIVSDEAYIDYCGDPNQSALSLIEACDNVLVIRSMSKIGLAGLRLGYSICDAALAHEIDRARRPFNVGLLSQRLGECLIERHWTTLHAAVSSVIAERERLLEALRALPDLDLFPTVANFVLCRYREAGDLGSMLQARGVLVRGFNSPGPLAACVRITVGSPAQNAALLAALGEILGPKGRAMSTVTARSR